MTRMLVAAALVFGFAGRVLAQGGVSGNWITTDFGDAPITIALNAAGTSLTGSINATAITEGKVDGKTVTFKATAANGGREVTYVGTLNGEVLTFTRKVVVRDAAANTGAGIFGANGPMQFTAARDNSANVPAVWRALVGNWVSNQQMAKYEGVPPATSRVPTHRRYMVRPNGSLGFISMFVDAGGNPVIFVGSGKSDGKDYPAHTPDTIMRLLEGEQSPRLPTIATRVVNNRTLEYTQKNTNGVITDVVTMVVGADGQTITETSKLMDPQGQQRGTRVLVYERQK